MSNHYASGDSDPKVKAFEEKYQKKYGAKPEAFAALGYDSVYILVDAIKRAGGTDGDKVAEALAKAKDLDLVTGKFSFEFDAIAADRTGDVFSLQNKKQEAVSEYTRAYASLSDGADYRRLLEVKLNAFGVQPKFLADLTTKGAIK